MEHTFSAEITCGPEFSLSQYADLADLYRTIRQEVDSNFSIATFTEESRAFDDLSEEARLDEICCGLSHFTSLGQGITIATGNGIGNLKSWALQLFKRLAKERTAKLCVIKNRQVQERELTSLPNVIQCAVPPYPMARSALHGYYSPAFGAKPEPPSDRTIRSIGGHPGIAKSAARLIAQKGLWVFEQNPRDLIDTGGRVTREHQR